MVVQEFRGFLRVFHMPVHPDSQRFNPADDQEGILRAQDASRRVLEEGQPFAQSGVFHHGQARDHITVPAQIFGAAVEHDIRAKGQRLLQIGRHKGVIHNREHMMPLCKFCHTLNISDGHQRICGALHQNRFYIRRDLLFQLVQIIGVRDGIMQVKSAENLVQNPVSAAIDIAGYQHSVTCSEK